MRIVSPDGAGPPTVRARGGRVIKAHNLHAPPPTMETMKMLFAPLSLCSGVAASMSHVSSTPLPIGPSLAADIEPARAAHQRLNQATDRLLDRGQRPAGATLANTPAVLAAQLDTLLTPEQIREGFAPMMPDGVGYAVLPTRPVFSEQEARRVRLAVQKEANRTHTNPVRRLSGTIELHDTSYLRSTIGNEAAGAIWRYIDSLRLLLSRALPSGEGDKLLLDSVSLRTEESLRIDGEGHRHETFFLTAAVAMLGPGMEVFADGAFRQIRTGHTGVITDGQRATHYNGRRAPDQPLEATLHRSPPPGGDRLHLLLGFSHQDYERRIPQADPVPFHSQR